MLEMVLHDRADFPSGPERSEKCRGNCLPALGSCLLATFTCIRLVIESHKLIAKIRMGLGRRQSQTLHATQLSRLIFCQLASV